MRMDLLLAGDAGDIGLVRELMKAPRADVNKAFSHAKFNKRSTALHYASRSGHLALVKVLVDEFGANIDAREKEDWTPVYYAANNGHTEIAEFLVERGADVTIRDNFNGRSPLEVAKYRQFQDIVSLLSAAERRHAATGASDGAGRVDVKKVRRKKNKKQEGGLVAGTGGEDEASYARPQSQIDKEGNRPVFGGVHFKHMDLFLGRYRLPDDAPGTIEAFRKSSKREDIIYSAVDTVLNVPVLMRHSHNRQRHVDDANRRREAGEPVLRSSVLSTNEFLLVVLADS